MILTGDGWHSGHTCLALIPARSGSQRIVGKNIRPLNGVPLIAYTIAAATQSGLFTEILCSTDSPQIADIARACGAAIVMRPAPLATATSPDIEWVQHVLQVQGYGSQASHFAILRPTSPFRTAATIRRAWAEYERSACDSLRAVQPAGVNPYKLWWMQHCELTPVLPVYDVPPWHSRPTQTLPPCYQQNASLEISRCDLVVDRLYPSLTGLRIWGFLNPEPEGVDLNTPDDWSRAEQQIACGAWVLPPVTVPPPF